MTKLKPCHFCGGEPRVRKWSPDMQHRDFPSGIWICSIRSGVVEVTGSSYESFEKAYEMAAKNWNQRAET